MEIDEEDKEEEKKEEEDEDEEMEDEDSEEQEQFRFGRFGQPKPAKVARTTRQKNQYQVKYTKQTGPWTDYFKKYKTISMFRTTILRSWQGLAYMFLDLGYPITNAVQDAMDES